MCAFVVVAASSGCGPDRTTACVPDAAMTDTAATRWPLHARLVDSLHEVAVMIHERIDDSGFAVRTVESWLDAMPPERAELPRSVASLDAELGSRRFDPASEYGREVAPAMASAHAALDTALRDLADRDAAAASYLSGRLLEWLDPEAMVRAGSP